MDKLTMPTPLYIYRNYDVITGGRIKPLHTIEQFPVFLGCTGEPEETDLKEDMCWYISLESGMIQLNPVLPLDIVYQQGHGSGCVGGLWLQHHKAFAKFIQTRSPKAVLEIGGAHGILSREYQQLESIEWTILEPNPSPVEGVNAEFIKGFFDDNFTFDGEIDTIIHSHVLEHVYYPDEFVRHLANFLKEGQKLIFSLPNMEVMLKHKYTNCINFEHTVFITEPYVEHLLSMHGFRQVEKMYFLDDHSIFYAYEKDEDTKVIDHPEDLYEHNKKLYHDYITYHENLIRDLNHKIAQTDPEQPIYLFGAHVFAQYLIGFGLKTDRIICLLDNDISKQGKRLYGTDMMVSSPKVLADVEDPIVILKAGVYNSEIKRDVNSCINQNVTYWE
ncbi:MAG: class I SAM-dependent methyltransferase [Sedimenticola sp.]